MVCGYLDSMVCGGDETWTQWYVGRGENETQWPQRGGGTMVCGKLRRGHNSIWQIETRAQWHMACWNVGTMICGILRRGYNGIWQIEIVGTMTYAKLRHGHNDIRQIETWAQWHMANWDVGTMACGKLRPRAQWHTPNWDVGTMAWGILKRGHNDTRAQANRSRCEQVRNGVYLDCFAQNCEAASYIACVSVGGGGGDWEIWNYG